MTEPLKITTSPRSDRQLDLTIELGPERTEQALQRAARQVAKRVNIPGFRKGKAPYQTVLRSFGREALLREVLDDLGQEVYQEALSSEQINPFAQAEVENIDLEPVTFKLVVPLSPEVDLGDYRSVRVEASEVSVTDADVDALIEEQRTARATWVEIDRPAELGDTVTLDIHGTVGEDSIMDNHDWDLLLKEESGWLPGFAEAFAGMSAGEEKSFTLTYPEDSASRYKGQEAAFQGAVKQVKARLEPDLNDEFAKSLGDYESVEDLRTKVREGLLRQRTAEAENKLNDAALEAVVAQAHLVYPPAAVTETVDEMLEEVRRNLGRSGYSLEDFVRLQGMTLDDYREKLNPQAVKRLEGRLVLGKLTQVEHIQATPEEMAAELERLAPAGSEDASARSFREALESDAGQLMIRQDVLTEKSLARLRAIVTGQVPELSAEPEAVTGSEAAAEAAPASTTNMEDAAPSEETAEEEASETEA